MDINGDGIIEQHEFVGFLEGQLNPEIQKTLGDSASQLNVPKSRCRSPLMVDRLLISNKNGADSTTFHNEPDVIFIQLLQQLERLYIHRQAYKKNLNNGKGGTQSRGVGVDLLLDVQTVKSIFAAENKISEMMEKDGNLEEFFHVWQQMLDDNQHDALPRSILYEVEKKRKKVVPAKQPAAWKAAGTCFCVFCVFVFRPL